MFFSTVAALITVFSQKCPCTVTDRISVGTRQNTWSVFLIHILTMPWLGSLYSHSCFPYPILDRVWLSRGEPYGATTNFKWICSNTKLFHMHCSPTQCHFYFLPLILIKSKIVKAGKENLSLPTRSTCLIILFLFFLASLITINSIWCFWTTDPLPLTGRPANMKCIPTSGQLCLQLLTGH